VGRYDGPAAFELDASAHRGAPGAYTMALVPRPPVAELQLRSGESLALPPLLLDPRPALRAAADDVARGTAPGVVAIRFHRGLAAGAAGAAVTLARQREIHTVALSGGVFQNRLLFEDMVPMLNAAGLRVLWPERLPPNDGGIAFGQAAVACRKLRGGPKAR
jgi:hydrogenase maturation protein HypF